MNDELKIINFIQDFGCATLKQLQILFNKPHDNFKNILSNNVYELSAKEFEENPFKNIRKYIVLNGEYTGTVIAFPKGNSGILVQLDNSKVTTLCRIPARFNNYPHFNDKVLIKVTEINENRKFIYSYLMRII